MKILMTGNPNENIAQGMKKTTIDEIDFVSRFNGYDLNLEEDVQQLVDKSVDYDVFINSSLLKNFAQTVILQKVWTEWRARNKSGHIISLGSSADYFHRADNKLYPIEKRALRDLNRSLSLHCTWHDSKIRTTYLSVGGVETPKTVEQWPWLTVHSIEQICDYIFWIIASPNTINIDELHITPIQLMERSKLTENNPKRLIPPKFESGDSRVYTKL